MPEREECIVKVSGKKGLWIALKDKSTGDKVVLMINEKSREMKDRKNKFVLKFSKLVE